MAQPSSSSITNLFNDSRLSDVTIHQVSGGEIREYKAHRALLAIYSKWFLNAFIGPYKEAKTDAIEMHDDDPDAFRFVLKYMYTDHYDDEEIKEMIGYDPSNVFLPHIKIFIVADKYDIERLRSEAMKNLEKAVWNMDEGIELLLSNLVVGVEAYYGIGMDDGTQMGSRLASIIHRHPGMRKFTRSPIFAKLVREFPSFAADVLLHERFLSVTKCTCSNCKKPSTYVERSHNGWGYCFECGKSQWFNGKEMDDE
ncbi:uncharacterized protein BDR25DRAFT_301007 [Lindgomyces ingoldianus]|uniref:Uncharacterized protein n=1 Tax=Lindgomyces ingoldianus TaxID=673940 RepID=A0ACB6R8Y9_9PLEO|nr:uncharacterized protein BDR25DRAFT_301007 [Lindgomyces ingoldianus]KAF2475210.1 hypothetical protein BDR25DRAFT_301007 [Lindgomyces ingoldianus]